MQRGNVLIPSKKGLFLYKNTFQQESSLRSDASYKLIYALNGPIHYDLSQRVEKLKVNQFIMVDPFTPHQQLFVEKQKFLIEINPSFLKDVNESFGNQPADIAFAAVIQLNPMITKWIELVIEMMTLEEDHQQPMFQLFLENSYTQLAILLLKHTIHTNNHQLPTEHFQTVAPAIYKVTSSLREAYQSPWSLNDMAAIIDWDIYHFSHYFKEIVGVSPYSWLQIYRLQRSLFSLKQNDTTILDTALNAGFSSIAVYNRLFKRVYGISPRTFRNNFTK